MLLLCSLIKHLMHVRSKFVHKTLDAVSLTLDNDIAVGLLSEQEHINHYVDQMGKKKRRH